jgi:hypothetical protein
MSSSVETPSDAELRVALFGLMASSEAFDVDLKAGKLRIKHFSGRIIDVRVPDGVLADSFDSAASWGNPGPAADSDWRMFTFVQNLSSEIWEQIDTSGRSVTSMTLTADRGLVRDPPTGER